MRGVREAGSRLASVVVELHQAEDQVRGHQLKRVRGIGYDIPAEKSTPLSPRAASEDELFLNSSIDQRLHPPFGTLALAVKVCVS